MVHRVVESLLIFSAHSSFDKSPLMFSTIFPNIYFSVWGILDKDTNFSSCIHSIFKNVAVTGKRFNRQT